MQINPLASTATPPPTTPASTTSPQSTENMFMQLLTAQLKTKIPLDPVDPTNSPRNWCSSTCSTS